MVTLQHRSLLESPEKAEGFDSPTMVWSSAAPWEKKRTARFLCPKQKNILEMLHIIFHSQFWFLRRNIRQDVPWPGMSPVAGKMAERRLLWKQQAGDRSKKAAPIPQRNRGGPEHLSSGHC